MQIPVQVTFKGIPVSESVQAAAWKHAEELEHFFDRITSCRVVIAMPQHRRHQGGHFSVRIDLAVPGEEIVVNREHRFDQAHEDVYVAMRDAFHAVRRQVEDYARRVRGQTKTHVAPAKGRVARLLPQRDCGFIETPDGREIYFHRRSLIEGAFDRLQVDDEVRFAEKPGENGPQASSVHPTRTHEGRSSPLGARP